MKESEEKAGSILEQKARIRERYKGISTDELDVIPARAKENIRRDNTEKRVAVYARVSTDDPNQTSSYELQKNHYTDYVNNHPNWNLVKIYADEGISGTSLDHRESFKEMIRDCESGKIDLVITKTVARFARNTVDCIQIERDLKKLSPPVGIMFETENIFTLDEDCEVILSIMAMMAQEESHTKSEIMNASIEMRFKRGIFLTPSLLGYDHDEDGNLVINEDEAKIVRLIFYMYMYGNTFQEIADALTSFGRTTKKGNNVWSAGTIRQILQNERHCGDVLARKTWTPSYLDHKSKRNNQDKNQYLKKNHHEPIIARDDFIAVQRMIRNARYGNKGILPELHVISDGVLRGYVSVNPRWAGFGVKEYRTASASIYEDAAPLSSRPLSVEAHSGDFDLRGYEIARAQFFESVKRISMTISNNAINFSKEAVRTFEKCTTVEMLIHPEKYLIAVRACNAENRNHMQWSRMHDGKYIPRQISGSAFLPTIYELFGWNPDCKYRLIGLHRHREDKGILIFDINDVEVLIPSDSIPNLDENLSHRKSIVAYPATWAENFGSDYYEHSHSEGLTSPDSHEDWDVDSQGTPYKESDLQISSIDEIRKNINDIITDIKQEAHYE